MGEQSLEGNLKMSRLGLIGRLRRLVAVVVAASVVLLVVSSQVWAAFGISPDPSDPAHPDFHMTMLGADEVSPYTQAGGHDFELTTSMGFESLASGEPDGRVRDIVVDLPPGFVGNTTAVPQCRLVDLQTDNVCPGETQVGLLSITVWLGFGAFQNPPTAVYNVERSPGDAATLAFHVVTVTFFVHVRVAADRGYAIRSSISRASEMAPLVASSLTLWGVPADPSHDTSRQCDMSHPIGDPCPSKAPREAFLTMGSDCSSQPETSLLHVDSWEAPGDALSYSDIAQATLTGCDNLSFDPSFTFGPAVDRAGAPSGYVFHLHVPQNLDPDAVGTPPLKDAVVTLPRGVRVSPSAAGGLSACSDAQIGLGSDAPSQCPAASRIGTVRIVTPLLPDPVEGYVYQGKPLPGRLFRVFIEAQAQGVRIKLPGSVDLDKSTGQITTMFANSPQTPFSDLDLTFKGGPRAPLSNPPACGTFTTTARFTPWSTPVTPVATPSSTFQITTGSDGGPCPAHHQFKPDFVAQTENPVAGRSSTFTLGFARGDADQELRGVSVRTPRGLTGRIADVPLCGHVQAALGTCGSASQIGTVQTVSGPGSNPFSLPGRVYLTGPYKGAPFGLSIVVRAVAGPFDLGTVVVRSAIVVDRHTAQLRVVSDPLPSILDGVPLQVRLVKVSIDRPGFMLNPTSCQPKHVSGVLTSTEGAVAHVGSRFQVADCGALGLRPKMRLQVGGRGHTGLHASTPLTTVLTMPKAGANLARVSVSLPLALNARLDVVNNACTQAQFDAGDCEQAKAGTATAITPLLKNPLRGGVYFVKDPNKPAGSLPNLVVALRGQVDFDLVGTIQIPGGSRLATSFNAVPDVPVSKFVLRLQAGSHGPLGVAQDLCTAKARRQRVTIAYRGQNGASRTTRQALHIAGCSQRR
jgi:hypothetical protein